MRWIHVAAVAMIVWSTAGARCVAEGALPMLQPTFYTAQWCGDASVKFTWLEPQTRWEERVIMVESITTRLVYEQVEGGGVQVREVSKQVKIPVQQRVMIPGSVHREAIVPVSSLKVYTPEGSVVSAEKLPHLLEEPQGVIVSANQQLVAPKYLKLLNAETLVFVSRFNSFPGTEPRTMEFFNAPMLYPSASARPYATPPTYYAPAPTAPSYNSPHSTLPRYPTPGRPAVPTPAIEPNSSLVPQPTPAPRY